jgi:molybdopterin synthase sulfur carrier subunit
MALRLVFLGRLEDAAGEPGREVPAGPLAEVLAALGPDLAATLSAPRIRLAVNGTLVADRASLVLADGDELAFLPPVSGG